MINRKKGFMISELVIGIVFLIMFIFINITLYINSSKNNIESRRFVQATNLLIKKVEEIQGTSFNDSKLNKTNVNSEQDPSLDEEVTIGTTKYEILVECSEVPNPEDFSTVSDSKTREVVENGVTCEQIYYNVIRYKPIAKIFTVNIMYGPDENKQIYTINTLKMMESEDIFDDDNIDLNNITEVIVSTEPIQEEPIG